MSNKHGSKWIRPTRRRTIYARDDGACLVCFATRDLTLDHIVPRAVGGGNESRNLFTSCRPCNSSRRHVPLERAYAPEVVRRILERARPSRKRRRALARSRARP